MVPITIESIFLRNDILTKAEFNFKKHSITVMDSYWGFGSRIIKFFDYDFGSMAEFSK